MMQTLQEQESFTIQGPQLEVFGQAETALPKPLKKKSNAALIAAVLAVVAVFGIGGAKLKGKAEAVRSIYAASSEHGNNIANDLNSAMDYAANVVSISGTVLGEDNAQVQAAQAALDSWRQTDAASPAGQYQVYSAVCSTVEAAYQQAAAAGGSKAQALTDENYNFTSKQSIIKREVVAYNEAAEAYNKTAQGFPAGAIGALWGAGKVEPFA